MDELHGAVKTNSEIGLQPVALTVKLALALLLVAISPSKIGNALGAVIFGEQGGPQICVSVKLLICVA